MNINTNITTGQFSLNFVGTIKESEYASIIEDGFKYRVHRGVFTKTELAMALAVGKTEEDAKTKKAKIVKGFKRGDVQYNADLAAKLASVAKEEMPGFEVSCTKYEPAPAGEAAKNNKLKAELGMKLALDQITVEEFKVEMAKLV